MSEQSPPKQPLWQKCGFQSEAELVELIERLVGQSKKKFSFPGYPPDEIAAEGRVIILKALEKYDPTKGPVENYASVSLANRMRNLRRDHFFRSDCPCKKCRECDDYHEPITHHKSGEFCRSYLNWRKSNSRKTALSRTEDLDDLERHVPRTYEEEAFGDVDRRDLVAWIERQLSSEERKILLRMRERVVILNQEHKHKLLVKIKKLLASQGLDGVSELF